MRTRNTLHVQRLNEALSIADEIAQLNAYDPSFANWRDRIEQSLGEVFGEGHQYTKRFSGLEFWPTRMTIGPDLRWTEGDQRAFARGIERTKAILQDALQECEFETAEHDAKSGDNSAERVGSELFLSHAAVDAALAEYLEATAKTAVPDLEVFRTTRVGELEPGREWFNEITRRLRSADRFMVLLTDSSMARPWVCFETGAAWFSDRTLVPVLGSDVNAHQVPEPLRLLQLLSLDDPLQAQEAFRRIGGELTDPEAFVLRSRELARNCRESAMEAEFEGIKLEGLVYAFDGPLESLPEADPVPIPPELTGAFQAAGYDCVFSIPSRPEKTLAAGYRKVWQIDRRNRKRPLLSRDVQQLYVRSRPQE